VAGTGALSADPSIPLASRLRGSPFRIGEGLSFLRGGIRGAQKSVDPLRQARLLASSRVGLIHSFFNAFVVERHQRPKKILRLVPLLVAYGMQKFSSVCPQFRLERSVQEVELLALAMSFLC
jgi:hypothetical protein